MENEKNSKVIAILALIVAVAGLGIGFAAFTSTLTISSSATVTPSDDTFKVVFDKEYETSGITCSPSGSASVSSSGTVDDTTITGIKVAFTKPGDSVTCTAQVKNSGEYEAYLNSITTGNLSCQKASESQATEGLVNEACKGIEATFTVGSDSATSKSSASESKSSIKGHTLSKSTSETVTIKIEYKSGSQQADGAFDVTIPQTSLSYSSADSAS